MRYAQASQRRREGIVAASEGYKLEDLLDIPRLQELFDGLNDAFPFPSAIIDNDELLNDTSVPPMMTVKIGLMAN